MRQSRRLKQGVEFKGTIISVRAIEDCIRATKKYTEGVGTMRKHHPTQGEGEFPSKKFVKYYEVYPDVDVSWDMSIIDAIFLLAGDRGTFCIDVLFNYDYRANKAEVVVRDGPVAVKQLAKAIPGFSDNLARVIANGHGTNA